MNRHHSAVHTISLQPYVELILALEYEQWCRMRGCRELTPKNFDLSKIRAKS